MYTFYNFIVNFVFLYLFIDIVILVMHAKMIILSVFLLI